MGSEREPTLRAAWLGQELRKLREAHKITATGIGSYLGKSQSSVSRLESGIHPAKEAEVIAYLDICKVTDRRRREDLLAMRDDVSQRGWWEGYGGDVANTLIDRMWIEARTVGIRACDLNNMPSLLQTPDYAEALFRIGNPSIEDKELERWREFRMTRQHIIAGHRPISLSCLIDECLLHKKTGDVETMRQQLDHLVSACDWNHVEIQIIPADQCHGVMGSFEILNLVDPYPRVGYVGTSVGEICVEGDNVDGLTQTYDRLAETALSLKASKKLLATERNKL